MVARHSSHIDAVVPLLVLEDADRLARYTLKEDLKWAPAMDLVGDRTPNVWINRSTPSSEMFQQIEQLAAEMPDNSTCVIFPEGTFRTPERHEAAIERLRSSRDDLADKANGLRYVLPPRPAGTLSLMRGAPDADIVVLANVGVEGRSSIKEIIATITDKRPIEVHAIRHPRSTVPTDDDEINAWLIERWIEMDDWIHHRVLERTTAPEKPSHEQPRRRSRRSRGRDRTRRGRRRQHARVVPERHPAVEHKGDGSPVTAADLAAEARPGATCLDASR